MLGVTMWTWVGNAQAIASHGIGWVARPLNQARGGAPLDQAETTRMHACGLGILVMYLPEVEDIFAGHEAGFARASTELQQAHLLGMPNDVPIWVAPPFWPYPGELADVGNYLSGWVDMLGLERVGVIGPDSLLAYARATGAAAWTWQTWPDHAAGVDQAAHIVHRTDLAPSVLGVVALQEARQGAAGLWMPPGVAGTSPRGV